VKIVESKSLQSSDGTSKLLLETVDGNFLETITLPGASKFKVCISSQLGCGFSCLHCKTGTVGLVRNLSIDEMVEQAMVGFIGANSQLVKEVLFFGAGEPFLNFANVVGAVRQLVELIDGLDSYGQIQISTSGVRGKILEFSRLDIDPVLAVSLHTAIAEKRERLIPQSAKYSVAQLRNDLLRYSERQKRIIIIQYTLIHAFNDTEKDIEELGSFLKDIPAVVHVRPFNPYEGGLFEQPSGKECRDFVNVLIESGINAKMKPSRGRDIGAACGHLVGTLTARRRGSSAGSWLPQS
jgi:23S rRNA (adenine2503-C2)-methyltransferase